MPDNEPISKIATTASVSQIRDTANEHLDERHWWNRSTVTDTDYDVEVGQGDQFFKLVAATVAVNLNLPPSDAASDGMQIRYHCTDSTNTVTVVRDGTDTINGAGSNPTVTANNGGMLISLGDGDWAHSSY